MESTQINSKDLKEDSEETIPELKDLSNSEITEEILKKCGGYGLFQRKLTVFIFIYVVADAFSFLTMVFLTEQIPFRCYPSNFNESQIPPNISFDDFLNNITVEESQCSVYNLDVGEEGFYVLPTRNSTKEPCNNGRKFYTKDLSSIVSEFDLVCGREWINTIAISVMFAGTLVGNLIFGPISDKFGRFKTFCFSEIVFICCSMTKVSSPNYVVFFIIYFFEGFGKSCTYIIAFTILLECVSQEYKLPLNFAFHGFFAIGEMLLAGVAYFIRDWKYLQIATTCPHVLILIIALKYLPESPRWLFNTKKFGEAKKLFNKITTTNNNGSDDSVVRFLRKLESEAEDKSNLVLSKTPSNKQTIESKIYTAIDMLRKPRRAVISVTIWINWFVNGMLYFGITLNSVDMSGNRYLNFFLMTTIEIPANILGFYCYHWFGHRKPLCFFMIFAGINCIVSNFVSKANYWIPLILTILGKLGATVAIDAIYLTSIELFPTVVRNSGLGVGASFNEAGALLSPIILGLTVYGSWIPLSVYGIMAIIAGTVVITFPEMKDSSLLQTLVDMDNL